MKNQIKYLQNLFYDLLNDYGQVYLVVKYSENTKIGNRGFTEEEKKKGLALIFNQKNHKNLQWTDDGSIVTALGFGTGNRPENCFLHADDLVSVFSPLAKIRFDRWDMTDIGDRTKEPPMPEAKPSQYDKVVSIESFRRLKPI
jgi:hypothetical protein